MSVLLSCSKILHQLCRGCGDEISMDDFSLFLFPKHPKSVEIERTRLKLLSEQVGRASSALQRAALRPPRRKSLAFTVLNSIQLSMKVSRKEEEVEEEENGDARHSHP